MSIFMWRFKVLDLDEAVHLDRVWGFVDGRLFCIGCVGSPTCMERGLLLGEIGWRVGIYL